MRFSARIFLAVLLLSAYCLAQSRNPYESSTEDNVYTNFFFRFRYSFTADGDPAPDADKIVLKSSFLHDLLAYMDRIVAGASSADNPAPLYRYT